MEFIIRRQKTEEKSPAGRRKEEGKVDEELNWE